jgi:hypothetical protein
MHKSSESGVFIFKLLSSNNVESAEMPEPVLGFVPAGFVRSADHCFPGFAAFVASQLA